jgi:4-amino-4-deoxy-L-arabinose transferase-like glycosyltransferase
MNRTNILNDFNKWGLSFVILIAFIIRMSFFISLQPWKSNIVNTVVIEKGNDMEGYHNLAVSLLSKKTFEDFNGFRTPGYPIFLAILYYISSTSIWFVLLIQIMLNLISILLVYKIVLIVSSHQVALLSSFLCAIDIHQALYSVQLLTDTLFVTLFLISIYFLCVSLKEYKASLFSLSAFSLGIATLVRPISFMLPFVIIILFIILSQLQWKERLIYSLLFGFIYVFTISPWIYNNYIRYGELSISSSSGYNLLFYYVSYTESYRSGKSIEEIRKGFSDLAIENGADTIDVRTFHNSKIYTNIAQKYIKENFILYCKRNIMGITNMYAYVELGSLASVLHFDSKPHPKLFGGPNILSQIIALSSDRSATEIFIAVTTGLYLFVNYILAIAGIIFFAVKNRTYIALFVLIILYFSILVGVVGKARYRTPIMPFINILCALGFSYLYSRWCAKKKVA